MANDTASNEKPAAAAATASSPSSTSTSGTHRVGVADYFAILGVGQDLVWKHAAVHQHNGQQNQQQQHGGQPSSSSSSPSASPSTRSDGGEDISATIGGNPQEDCYGPTTPAATTTTSNGTTGPSSSSSDGRTPVIAEEDDAMLLQRFYREIVECDIAVVPPPAAVEAAVGGETRQHHPRREEHRHLHPASSMDNSTDKSTDISSPSGDRPTNTLNYVSTKKTEGGVLQREGWTTVHKTRPAPASTSNNRIVPPSTTPTPLWNKGQTWEANLDICGGLTGQVLSMASTATLHDDQSRTHHQQQRQQRRDKHRVKRSSLLSASSSASHHHQGGGGVMGHGAALVRSNVTAPLKDLRKKMQSTIQSASVVQQFLHRTRSQEEGDALNDGKNISNASSYVRRQPFLHKYYLTYKRRSPDQSNLPAIADIALYYVRIHVITMIPATNVVADNMMSNDNNIMGKAQQQHAARGRRRPVALQSMLALPEGFEEWAIPRPYRQLMMMPREPHWMEMPNHPGSDIDGAGDGTGNQCPPYSFMTSRTTRSSTTVLFPESGSSDFNDPNSSLSQGIEAVDRTLPRRMRIDATNNGSQAPGTTDRNLTSNNDDEYNWRQRIRPRLVKPNDKSLLKLAASSNATATIPPSATRYNTSDWHTHQPRPNNLENAVVASALTNSTSGEDHSVSTSSFDNSHDYGIYNHEGHEEVDWNNKGGPEANANEYIFIPVLAIRRQRIGEEERFLEDPAVVDIAVSFLNQDGQAVLPAEDYMYQRHQNEGSSGNDEDDDDDGKRDDDEDDDNVTRKLVSKTKWNQAGMKTARLGNHPREQQLTPQQHHQHPLRGGMSLGVVCLLTRHNIPVGFCDAPFATSVLDRFPYKNYKGLPLPEEELPMFCYPIGCRLHRAKYCDAPLPQYYGFVVKNERGDSIYVSCVSFMEPLTNKKKEQLAKLSEKRRRVSLPHKRFCARRRLRLQHLHRRQLHQLEASTARTDSIALDHDERLSRISVESPSDWIDVSEVEQDYIDDEDGVLTAFDQMTTFENKTICILSRYPFWTAFRRFLSHLHSISGSCADLPLERYISHLLLCVPVPKPGGPSILIPLPTFNVPMMLCSPPHKDLPLIDLPFERLVACLDVPTIVTVVLGLLCLEQKVIVMSTRPSLVLDACELLRSLLFPFELVAPYVPRLTEPFMSCLEFPGAIFVGIHDDGTPDGLAAIVRREMPEDSTMVDLDTGNVDCHGDRITVLNNSWSIIPTNLRSVLVSEIETLCRDASIIPGQEPLDSQLDSAFEASIPTPTEIVQDDIPLSNVQREALDDRAIRDSFLRFFCCILAGYERYLVVPDVDFLISGNEWFDAKGFLASAPEENTAFLGSLVSTQLFQSFIQRRTEASDVHLLLFDECLQEYHSSTVRYGRLGDDMEALPNKETGKPLICYSLLVDQSAAEQSTTFHGRSFDGDSRGHGSDTDNCSGQHLSRGIDASDPLIRFSDLAMNSSGDWVTIPCHQGIPRGSRFLYCIDGNPTFPDRLNPNSFMPRQPESWLVEMSTESTPMLTRSGKEIEEADRRRKFATSYRGLHSQRKCMWQLPKLMGSHFLGTWLLCLPSLVAQPHLSHEQQSKYLLRALGALRLLRNKQKIVPDEAAYRSLIVACGRTKNDRRTELVKLFGLLRSDGIFPSAVTLGQYTRALAEGYSKRAVGPADEEHREESAVGHASHIDVQFDPNLALLEDSGRRWRQKTHSDTGPVHDDVNTADSRQNKRRYNKAWFPVVVSSSFVPPRGEEAFRKNDNSSSVSDMKLTALWSRTVACGECSYIPLDEEIQGGWDAVYGGEHDIAGSVACPRCGSLLIPKLAYKTMSVHEAIRSLDQNDGLPPQLRRDAPEENSDHVTYLSPLALRKGMEQAVDDNGEAILDREMLRATYPELFYNLWWLCARFQLPLPLAVGKEGSGNSSHRIAVAAWDRQVAMRGCFSCARIVDSESSHDLQAAESAESLDSVGDFPLLSKFNLSGYYANVWDHKDLSKVLVTLVEACDKRDFRPVIECVQRCNKGRAEDELESYRTVLYLAKYQCTSAFHAFFPATLKPCKGYHFWCPIAPLPVFDHLYREAEKRIQATSTTLSPTNHPDEIALAFRSVFGHLI